MSKNTF